MSAVATMTNPHEEKARLIKAYTLADALRRHEWDSEEAATLTSEEWQEIAEGIRVKPPSDLTVQKVLEIMRGREVADEAKAGLHPFRGLRQL